MPHDGNAQPDSTGAVGSTPENAAAEITNALPKPGAEHGPLVNVRDDNDANNGLDVSRELTPPPLPPRPGQLDLLGDRDHGSLQIRKKASRPQLQTRPTTALSRADVHTQNHRDISGSRSPGSRVLSRKQSYATLGRKGSDLDDSGSLRSYAPTNFGDETESLLGVMNNQHATTPAWQALSAQLERDNPFERSFHTEDFFAIRMQHEFDEFDEYRKDGANEEQLLNEWRARLKHFFILSSSGKPIWSRHGDDQLISNYIGVVQTIISFYQDKDNNLRTFTAGNVRFAILMKGNLNLVAISKLGESDGQLRTQLESLYMQILSTLTLPSMQKMFSNRPSTDLRRPLQGTEVLLDALADGFTRGSPSTLLSALECLKLRKSHRTVINNTLLKTRSPNLLYGLLVGGGRLVSVVRPKKHSLHPGDLHLIFNMLFEAGSVKAGGGENWIPLCLPGFNNTGYLYMYVSFLSSSGETAEERPTTPAGKEDELAVILISANKEGFYELRQMRDDLVEQLQRNGSMAVIRAAVRRGHPSVQEIVPGTVLRHFIYKSRGNVQFTMPSFEPHFHGLVARRR